MKNTLERINIRLGDIEECLSNLEDRIMEIMNQNSKKKDKHQVYQYLHHRNPRRRKERL